SFNVNGRIYSNVRRVKDRGNNLLYVDYVNTFSRNFCGGKYNLEEALVELEKIRTSGGTGKFLITFGASLSASAFTGLIGGNISQCIVAFFVGLFSWLIHLKVEKKKYGYFIDTLINGILVSTFAILFTEIFNMNA